MFSRNMEVLNRGLLSLVNAARALGFATPFVNEASRLRDDFTNLYFFIQTTVMKMQDAWFDHGDFDQFTIARSANLVLHHSLNRAREGRFTEHVDRVSGALERLDQVLLSPSGSSLTDWSLISLRFLFSRMLVHRQLFCHCSTLSRISAVSSSEIQSSTLANTPYRRSSKHAILVCLG
jgi:hypothetical protein